VAKQSWSVEQPRKKWSFARMNFDLSKTFNIAAQMVIGDIVNKNEQGLDINGETLTPLKPITVTRKALKKAKYPNRPLHDTGLMLGRGSIKGVGGRGPYIKPKATKSKQTAVINVAKKREEIGVYHNEGGKGGNPPQREWFGISKEIEDKIEKMAAARIETLLRNA
jgi:hypothetical protein